MRYDHLQPLNKNVKSIAYDSSQLNFSELRLEHGFHTVRVETTVTKMRETTIQHVEAATDARVKQKANRNQTFFFSFSGCGSRAYWQSMCGVKIETAYNGIEGLPS